MADRDLASYRSLSFLEALSNGFKQSDDLGDTPKAIALRLY